MIDSFRSYLLRILLLVSFILRVSHLFYRILAYKQLKKNLIKKNDLIESTIFTLFFKSLLSLIDYACIFAIISSPIQNLDTTIILSILFFAFNLFFGSFWELNSTDLNYIVSIYLFYELFARASLVQNWVSSVSKALGDSYEKIADLTNKGDSVDKMFSIGKNVFFTAFPFAGLISNLVNLKIFITFYFAYNNIEEKVNKWKNFNSNLIISKEKSSKFKDLFSHTIYKKQFIGKKEKFFITYESIYIIPEFVKNEFFSVENKTLFSSKDIETRVNEVVNFIIIIESLKNVSKAVKEFLIYCIFFKYNEIDELRKDRLVLCPELEKN